MLVLTRKPNQQLRIGEDIVITVVKVRGNTIRLGIEAPKDVRVIRAEIEAREQSVSEASATKMTILSIAPDTEVTVAAAQTEGDALQPAVDGLTASDASSTCGSTPAGSVKRPAKHVTGSGCTPDAPLKAYTRGAEVRGQQLLGRSACSSATDKLRSHRTPGAQRVSSLVV